MRSAFQERFQVYVMGPNQDPRLALVTPGVIVDKVRLKLDSDAPFVLRGRAIAPFNANMPFLATKWMGPEGDYRQSGFILESLQQPYFGQNGSPTPVSPEIVYPPGGVITLDLSLPLGWNLGTVANVTFYWIGVKRYPWGYLPAPTYPAEFRGSTFAQEFRCTNLLAPDMRSNQPFTVRGGDFVIRAGMAGQLNQIVPGCPPVLFPGILTPTTAMSVILKDRDGMPYMNDFVDINVLFGMAAGVGVGTGPEQPGLIYPEIYLEENHQLLIDVQQSAAGSAGADLLINFIGAKIFKGARE